MKPAGAIVALLLAIGAEQNGDRQWAALLLFIAGLLVGAILAERRKDPP